jgi:6-methylsalicylate decarboxylase
MSSVVPNAEKKMSTNHRIDVHQHVLPPFWVKALPTHGGDPSGPRSGDPSHRSSSMVARECDRPDGLPRERDWNPLANRAGHRRLGQAQPTEMARRVNEYTADLAAKRPDRFGNFATLPLPDVDGALSELEYALDTLRADGVILLGNYAEEYLGDPAFEPLWVELDRRQSVVFVHPGLPLPQVDGVAGPLVDYRFDTTRTAVQLVLNGVVDRYPLVRIILAHAGGFVPYAPPRHFHCCSGGPTGSAVHNTNAA